MGKVQRVTTAKNNRSSNSNHTHRNQDHTNSTHPEQAIRYVLDTNVLIHDPTALLNFEEHHVVIPMTVLEELDKLKSGRQVHAADCRQAIREIDRIFGPASPNEVEQGVPVQRESSGEPRAFIRPHAS